MSARNDRELLQAYALENSETAFAELVRRHVHLVYSVALRLVVDPHLAEDVTQGTFIALAQTARKLTGREVLSSWLHLTARNVAAKLVRTEERRRAREREAVAMEVASPEPEQIWSTVVPHLDEAIGALSDQDRDAVMLRFFERKTAPEMAQVLGVSEEAAQKRVSRAVERLRDLLAKRGLAVGASALVVCLSTQAVQAAPASLTATLATAALAGATAAQAVTTATLSKTVAMTAMQKSLITATVAVVAGAGIYEGHQASRLHTEVQALQRQQAPLKEEFQRLQRERATAANRLALLADEGNGWKSNNNELVKLRGEVALLRQASEQLKALRRLQSTDRQAAATVAWLDRVQQLKERVAHSPEASIPEMASLKEVDWLMATRDEFNSEADYRRALSRLRSEAERYYLNPIRAAVVEFTKANGGNWPTDLAQVKPYLQSPIEDAILQRYELLPGDTLPLQHPDSGWVLTQKATPPDPDNDVRVMMGASSEEGLYFKDYVMLKPFMAVIGAYFAANKDRELESADPARFAAYARTPEQQAALAWAIKDYESASAEKRAAYLKMLKRYQAR